MPHVRQHYQPDHRNPLALNTVSLLHDSDLHGDHPVAIPVIPMVTHKC